MTERSADEYFDEGDALARLHVLIRRVYPARQADEIVASFQAVLTAHTERAERQQVIEYWTDFYRLHEYRQKKQRRRPRPTERMQPCAACGHPSSHRHHLWNLADHGENEITIQLCANCHEINHLMYNALVKDSEYSRSIVLHIMATRRVPPDTLNRVLAWCLAVIRYEAEQGWIDGAKGAREAVEARLNWTEYMRTLVHSAHNTHEET